ncbi:DUF3825 domain-containing protein [Rudaea sp.]|uniref:DUF3825 domain-containing protein n=1 Tax=Rudaea sp. TaxID=2136325 RepID=UPI002ED07D96
MKNYESLFRHYYNQPFGEVFAHFYPPRDTLDEQGKPDYDEPFKAIARATGDGYEAWTFRQDRFKDRHKSTAVPKLKNYLNYTFVRLLELEKKQPGKYFSFSADKSRVAFNTGLQTPHGSDLLATFQQYKPKAGGMNDTNGYPDWVFKGCHAPSDRAFRDHFGTNVPEIAWYSADSRDFVFDVSYKLDGDVFDHLFERAKERAGLPNVSDEVVRTYLKGALERLVPRIKRNYKVAIPVYYVEERRMQLLLPFESASSTPEVSCFLIEREDVSRTYRLKTIFDLDQAYFSARLITRPDREWLDP